VDEALVNPERNLEQNTTEKIRGRNAIPDTVEAFKKLTPILSRINVTHGYRKRMLSYSICPPKFHGEQKGLELTLLRILKNIFDTSYNVQRKKERKRVVIKVGFLYDIITSIIIMT
jgi:hypothetical protein